jgi:pimeloyl-ACP methyl ester carboxylesterase
MNHNNHPTIAAKPQNIEAIRHKPAMMAYGMKDVALPPWYYIRVFRHALPNAAVVELENAGHFCQEDQPDTLVALINQFIELT